MITAILYLHGYGSGPHGDTAVKLRKHLEIPGTVFICPQLDHTADPLKLYNEIVALGQKLDEDYDDIIVIGSSAGGFWAQLLNTIFGFKTVLINPSLRPEINFRKYELPDDYYDTYERIGNQSGFRTAIVFTGTNDQIVPIEHIHKYYKNPIMLEGEGHRLNCLDPIIDMVLSMIGNFPEL